MTRAFLSDARYARQHTNWARNPRAITSALSAWSARNGTGEALSSGYITGLVGPPGTNVTTAYRKTVFTAKTGGLSRVVHQDPDAAMAGLSGDYIYGSVWVRPSVQMTMYVWIEPQDASGINVGSNARSIDTVCPANVWTRLSIAHRTDAAYASVQVSAYETPTSIMPVGGTLDVTAVLLEKAKFLNAYLDGSTPRGKWSGVPNASISTGPGM